MCALVFYECIVTLFIAKLHACFNADLTNLESDLTSVKKNIS